MADPEVALNVQKLTDVVALAEPVLKHRMALTFSARADGETLSNVIGRLTARLAG